MILPKGQTPYEFEAAIMRALEAMGGPPELAPQLIAIGEKHELTAELPRWIQFHTGRHWSGHDFAAWCEKLKALHHALKVKEITE